MLESLRRLRGVIGTSLTWAAAWFGVGAAGWGLGLFPEAMAFAMPSAANLAVVGAIAGGAFAVVLGFADRTRTLDGLTLPRMATWGAVGGILIGVPMGIGMVPIAHVGTCAFLALLGAGSAVGSLALARMGEPDGLLEDPAPPAPELSSGQSA